MKLSTILSIAGAVAGVATLAGLLIGAIHIWNDAKRVQAVDRCAAAAKSATAPLDDCPAGIAPLIAQARKAGECDAALDAQAKGQDQLYAIRAVCSAPVKALQADDAAPQSNVADLKRQLTDARAATSGAVDRAVARATATAKREATNDQVIANAPRSPDGRVVCDARCLRALTVAP